MKTKQVNQPFVELAETFIPHLYEKKVYPVYLIDVEKDPTAFQGWRTKRIGTSEELADRVLNKGDSITLDFGDHHVGYLSFSINNVNSNADAPLRLKLIFGEMPCEIAEDFDDYEGWLSRSWLQDEVINIDVLPGTVTLPRRYTFRYLKIIVLATSQRYSISIPEIYCTTVTSGDIAQVKPLPDHLSEELRTMDRIGIKTLQDCMHTVFEDGPKRDRRLWIGDLRLQALANYETFNSNDLVKRCLYLFGGMLLEDGQVGACLYEKPAPFVDDIYLYDYALFFVVTLYDYYEATKDRDTLVELWPIATEQLHIGLQRLDERGIVKDDDTWYCFLDWHEELNKQAGAQAVLIYSLKRGLAIAAELDDSEARAFISTAIKQATEAAITHLWDQEQGYFTSGPKAQVSWASQIWMVLAEVLDAGQSSALLDHLFEQPPAISMSTPYLYHHLIEALILCGKKEKALEEMRAYWGEMIKDGADTFWELYNPNDKKLSPYGSNLINSYCHAWSCTPTYFIRKYYMDEDN